MKTSFFKKLVLALAIIYIPMGATAWGVQGHRIAGQIAASYLTPKARQAIAKILGNQSIALAGNWADFIRSDAAYSYLTPWHYIDFDKAYTYPEMQEYLKHDTVTNAYTKLQFLIGELKKKNISAQNKLLYLRMLIHITEDIHQPMHAAHSDDRGGNDFKLTWLNTPTNLHSLWDSGLIDFQQLSFTEYAASINHTTAAQRAEWQKDPVSDWVFESNQIAQKLYTEIKPNDVLGYKYNFTHIAIVNQQLLKAGVRLAGLLNQLFD